MQECARTAAPEGGKREGETGERGQGAHTEWSNKDKMRDKFRNNKDKLRDKFRSNRDRLKDKFRRKKD